MSAFSPWMVQLADGLDGQRTVVAIVDQHGTDLLLEKLHLPGLGGGILLFGSRGDYAQQHDGQDLERTVQHEITPSLFADAGDLDRTAGSTGARFNRPDSLWEIRCAESSGDEERPVALNHQ